jgi:drug/metabolite transporter (DMT)-like permease
MVLESKSMRPAAAIAFTVTGMVMLASSDAIVKHLTGLYAIAQILWIRYVLFAAYGTWLAFSEHGRDGYKSACLPLQLVRGTVLVCANLVFLFSFSRLPLVDVHALIAAAPVIVTCASVFVLNETVGVRRWLAIAVGFCGVLVMLRPGAGVFQLIALAPLLGAGLYSSYQILTKLVGRHDTQAKTQFFTGMTGLFWFSLIAPFVWKEPHIADFGWLAATAVAGTLAHIFIIRGLHLAPASTLQPFSYSMLVAATWLGYVFFDEIPDAYTLVGASIIVASGLYTWHRERLSHRPDGG